MVGAIFALAVLSVVMDSASMFWSRLQDGVVMIALGIIVLKLVRYLNGKIAKLTDERDALAAENKRLLRGGV